MLTAILVIGLFVLSLQVFFLSRKISAIQEYNTIDIKTLVGRQSQQNIEINYLQNSIEVVQANQKGIHEDIAFIKGDVINQMFKR